MGPDADVPNNAELDAAEPPLVKKPRVDGKWRTNRAIISRDRAINSRDKELVQLKSEVAASTVRLKSEVAASVAASTVREYNTKQDAQKMIDNVTIKCNAKIRHKGKVAADVLENVKNKYKARATIYRDKGDKELEDLKSDVAASLVQLKSEGAASEVREYILKSEVAASKVRE